MLGNDHARRLECVSKLLTTRLPQHKIFSRMTIRQFNLLTLNHLTNTTDLFPEWFVLTNVITQNSICILKLTNSGHFETVAGQMHSENVTVLQDVNFWYALYASTNWNQ